MSFAYKKISPSDISVYPYEVNKSFNIENLFDSGITLYIGENLPLDQIRFFDPENDDKTTNNEYRRLIYQSIKHLFYKNYNTNGEFLVSSSYDNYLQTKLYSGSNTSTFRILPNITGSSYQGVNSIYNQNVIYDDIYNYDEVNFDGNRGNLITILSIDKNIYGNNIKPTTFLINTGSFYIKDDGEGNIFDYNNETNYNEIISSGSVEGTYIGNIIYSLGIIVITNQDYICILGSPPIVINNYYSYKNIEQPINFDITENDYSDCNGIDYSSIELIPLDNFDFPDCYIGGDGFLYIIQNQKSYIPGIYKLGYSIKSNNGLLSNTGSINLNIDQYPLEINYTSSKVCNSSISYISYSFDIFGGTPIYSYSWDNQTYYTASGFLNVSISGSILSTTNSLYIKDYLGNIVSKSLSNYYDDILYSININNSIACDTIGSVNIETEQGIKFILSGSLIEYNTNELIYLPTGSYTASIIDNNNCEKLINFSILQNNPITYNITTQSINCNGDNDGSIIITNITGGLEPYDISYYSLFSFPVSSSNIISNLTSNTYYITVTDGNNCSVETEVIINEPTELILTTTGSYEFSCYSTVELNITGGTPPYNYIVSTPQNIYTSDSNIINMINDGLNGFYVTASVIDNNGCIISTTQEIYGRTYIYSGSYCEEI